MAVIDASVYVSLINDHEPGYDRSWQWLRQTRVNQEQLVAPAIMVAEVAAALSRGLGDPVLAHQAVRRLHYSRLIQLLPVTRSLADQAAVIAADHQIRGCDAIYVALAEQLATELVTLEKQQLERGTAVVFTRQP